MRKQISVVHNPAYARRSHKMSAPSLHISRILVPLEPPATF